MAGGNISYHLRPNKYVERRLFVDLLGMLSVNSRDSYVYISLGGPQLEDHRLVHYELGINKLISIEQDPTVHSRQLFNARPGCIDCRLQSVDELIADFPSIDEEFPDDEYIVWLDYAGANERFEQLSEFQSLLATLNAGDFIKITINARVNTLGERMEGEEIEALHTRRFEKAKGQLNEYFDQEKFDVNDITGPGFKKILRRAIQIAVVKGLPSNLHALNVLSFSYQDGPHIMLNVGFKLFDSQEALSQVKTNLETEWPYFPRDDEDIKVISIPNLTVKERLHIDSQLFKVDIDTLHANLPFRFSNNENASKATLDQYYTHYRRYPHYIDVNI